MVTSNTPLVGNNVTLLNTDSVHQDIMAFLKNKNIGNGDKLQGTAAEYERDIRRFFQVMLNKTTNQLTIEDLDIVKSDVLRFQTFLVDNGYKSATVNRNINTMRSLYSFFQDNPKKYRYKDEHNEFTQITTSPFNVDDVVLNDAKTYGMFTHEEMKQMIELAKELPNGIRKSMAIEFASKTAFRIESVCSITKKDFTKEGNVWVAHTIDKKKPHDKPIEEEFYNRLMQDVEDKVFDFSTKTLERVIKELTEKMELDPDRNLTFHSIKKYSMGEVYYITKGDPLAVAKHGNHSSFETSMKYYLLFANQHENNPALLIGKELDLTPLEQMSKEELLELISKSSRSVQYELLSTVPKK